MKNLGAVTNGKHNATKEYVDAGLDTKADQGDLYIVEGQKKYKLTLSVVGGHLVEHYEEVTT